MTDEKWLSALREAHAVRAAFYYGMLCELRRELGEERALAIIGRVCHAMGLAKGDRYRVAVTTGEPVDFCTYFSTHNPVNTAVFDISADGDTVRLGRCPLVEGWRAQGASAEDIAKLCRAAREVDHGTLAGAGFTGTFTTLAAEGDDACCLTVRRCAGDGR